jgi:hypothetical protein
MNTRGGDPMSDEEGLLSGLPKTRPGVQTRRRAEAREAAKGESAPSPGVPPSPDDEPTPAERPEHPSVGGAVGGLARVSAEAAAGTAIAGLRLAGRAAGGLGKALTRR